LQVLNCAQLKLYDLQANKLGQYVVMSAQLSQQRPILRLPEAKLVASGPTWRPGSATRARPISACAHAAALKATGKHHRPHTADATQARKTLTGNSTQAAALAPTTAR
jgi:hypothetical protein